MSFNDRDYELLSAYIDDALTPDERMALEARLATDDALREELEALRQVVQLVHDLPALKAPRNFTLQPEMLAPKSDEKVIQFPDQIPTTVSPRRAFPATLTLLGAVASVVVVFVLVLALLRPALNDGLDGNGDANIAMVPTNTASPTALATSVESLSDAAGAMPEEAPEMIVITPEDLTFDSTLADTDDGADEGNGNNIGTNTLQARMATDVMTDEAAPPPELEAALSEPVDDVDDVAEAAVEETEADVLDTFDGEMAEEDADMDMMGDEIPSPSAELRTMPEAQTFNDDVPDESSLGKSSPNIVLRLIVQIVSLLILLLASG